MTSMSITEAIAVLQGHAEEITRNGQNPNRCPLRIALRLDDGPLKGFDIQSLELLKFVDPGEVNWVASINLEPIQGSKGI